MKLEKQTKTMITRRKAITAGGTVILAPSFVGVASGATSSGNIELTTTSTIPTDTSIDVRINEDTTGDGSSNNSQLQSLSGGTDEITEYSELEGFDGDGNSYWIEITLTTNDDTVTPELDTATITLPENDGGGNDENTKTTPTDTDSQGLDGIIDNYLFFIAAVITGVAGIGLMSKSLAIGAVAAYTTFALIAIETGEQLLQNILVVTLVMVFIGFSFKFWRLEGMGE